MKKTIIGLTGLMGSGKEKVKEYIREKYGAEDYQFSTPLRDVLTRLSIDKTRVNISTLSKVLRETFGQETLARVMASDAENSTSQIIVMDGVRRMSDITYLKELPGFVLVKIEADPKVRFQRIVARNQNVGDGTKTYEQFVADQNNLEAEKSVPGVMEHATLSLDNNGSLPELYTQIEAMMKELSKTS